MTDNSPILSLPLIQPAQAQKHVTHNEAVMALDVVVQLAVADRTRSTPPATPAEGDRHIVATGATGTWAGQAGRIALWQDGAWQFVAPLPGFRAWVAAEEAVASWNGTVWATLADGPLTVQRLGVATSPDAVNRLAVASEATLLSHAGAGHQLKLNKAAASDTASLLFQTGWSGRAEMGTVGADGFQIRVSADGSSFATALEADPATGTLRLPQGVRSDGFTLRDAADPTKQAVFSLTGIGAGQTRTLTLPNGSGEVAILATNQTFNGNKTFSGGFTVSSATATLGSNAGNTTLGMGTGATGAGQSKTVNIGTGGLTGSATTVTIGSDQAGAAGTLVVNTPVVSFASAVTSVAMTEATVSARFMGLGGATGDATNRLSVNSPAVLFNHAGAGTETTLNKAAAGNDAAIAFKTGFSARGLVGLLGNDDLTVKVSPDGTSYAEAMVVRAATGRVELPRPAELVVQTTAPAAPAAGRLALYARGRAGQAWLDVARPSGRDFPLQAHMGVNRVATWGPLSAANVGTMGMPRTGTGTVSTPALSATNLSTSMRRWRVTSAATADSAAEERSGQWICWRGNAAGLGGWTLVSRLSLTTIQPTGMGFFGLYGSTSALPATQVLSAVTNCIGIGYQAGTHTNWQIVTNDATGAPTLSDLGSAFALNTTDVLTLYLGAAPNAATVGLRLVNESTGVVQEVTLSADLPADSQFLSPRHFMNNGATAAAVAFDCAGLYVETDF